MEYAIAAISIVIICIIGLQEMQVRAHKAANDDLEAQLASKDRDVAEARFKEMQLREELRQLPVVYKKPDAIHITLPGRRREDMPPMVGGGVSWED